MTSSTPNHDDGHRELREALQRDAARMQEPPFDAVAHHATMRQIRALPHSGAAASGLRPRLVLAACVALLLIVATFPRRERSHSRPDVAAAIASTQNAIARLSLDPASTLPAWMSPTASLLQQPGVPPGGPREPSH